MSHLHATALQALLRSPMTFFDSTPLGRITNRFSADLQKVTHKEGFIPARTHTVVTVSIELETVFLLSLRLCFH